jgi:aerobic-type carbon monoxide dehydrogenase small subunit (CoxS/CutS family)
LATARLTVNGRTHEVQLEPRVSLLDALRKHLALASCRSPSSTCWHSRHRKQQPLAQERGR